MLVAKKTLSSYNMHEQQVDSSWINLTTQDPSLWDLVRRMTLQFKYYWIEIRVNEKKNNFKYSYQMRK